MKFFFGRTTIAAIAALAIVLTGCTSEVTLEQVAEVSTEPTTAAARPATAGAEAQDAAASTAETALVEQADEAWTLLGTFDTASGIRRTYVLVMPGLSEPEIVDIVDELRTIADADPSNDGVGLVEHYLFDDDSQFDVLLMELPNTEAGDSSRWPVDYVVDHTVADSKAYFIPDGAGGADQTYLLCAGAGGCDIEEALASYDAS